MRTALLTGIGREGQVGEVVAARLGADGFELLIVDRTAENVHARAAALRSAGYAVTAFAADLSDPESVSGLFARIAAERPGGLSAVVHMAGGFAASGSVAETRVEDWDHQLSINLRTAFLVTRSAIPALRLNRGSIVLFSSESVLPGSKVARVSAYTVAKSGVSILSAAIAQEEQSAGIRSNVLAPAAVRTAANVAAMPPASKFVEREDVAATVSYLCSDEAAAVTGQIIRLSPR